MGRAAQTTVGGRSRVPARGSFQAVEAHSGIVLVASRPARMAGGVTAEGTSCLPGVFARRQCTDELSQFLFAAGMCPQARVKARPVYARVQMAAHRAESTLH